MPQKNKTQSKPDYEQMGRMLADVYELGYLSKKRMFFLTLLRGIAMGLGSVIGATIVVALILWLLSLVDFVPLLGPIQEQLQNSLNSSQ